LRSVSVEDFVERGAGATETFENKIGDSLEQIQQTFKDFKIDMSFSTKKEKQSKKFN